ncbi:family 16 glycosylhydrolase [Azospirillum soli]|uniref:family 16 glycosylhydrolase n=1 Tax=Azospirillum soli TaxID=1304799 RepID=UPI001AE7C373|nr:family 16 glycosylhydrolase [Azospirillum soli]MBP2312039.1 endoglucanase [Azospirillum soli]
MRKSAAALLLGGVSALLVFGGAAGNATSLLGRTGGSDFEDRFQSFDTMRWQKADGWTNGNYMGCGFRAQNLSVSDGRLALSITEHPTTGTPYACAEYRTRKHYGYGTYAVNLKAVKADGVMTAFSTYTGQPFGHPWDEITFGINGKDTTKAELNYVANGVTNHDVVVDLGFDAAKGFHTYSFEWKPDRITWFADGRPIHTVQSARDDLPQTPGRIYVQLWNGKGETSWLKRFQYPGKPVTAEVAWVRYKEAPGDLVN